jgi:hypothetical protein
MKVLVACEFSGIVRDAFRANGHDAISCDLTDTERDGPHIIGDVTKVLNWGWDLMVAHPPCTYLCNSGTRFHYDGNVIDEALEFVETLLAAPIQHIALENPPGVISTWIRKPDQYVEPWWFGDNFQKKTGLWLKDLPLLQKQAPATWFSRSYIHTRPPSKDRSKDRSRTFPGFAKAMADQWGGVTDDDGLCRRQAQLA